MVNKVKMWEVSDPSVDMLVHLHAQHTHPHIIKGGHIEDHLNIYNQELLQVSLIIHQMKNLINLMKICCKWLYSKSRLY